MNLIKQLGGYEAAKNYLAELQKIPMHEQTEDTIVWLPRELLEYRREHDSFEEGDQVVIISKRHAPKLWKWAHSTNWRPGHSLLDCGDGTICPFSDYEFRHATDEEIANNARSK